MQIQDRDILETDGSKSLELVITFSADECDIYNEQFKTKELILGWFDQADCRQKIAHSARKMYERYNNNPSLMKMLADENLSEEEYANILKSPMEMCKYILKLPEYKDAVTSQIDNINAEINYVELEKLQVEKLEDSSDKTYRLKSIGDQVAYLNKELQEALDKKGS